MAPRRCCVPYCTSVQGGEVSFHRFPNPGKPDTIETFRTWVMKIGGDIVGEDDPSIHRNRRVCDLHFASCYMYPNNRIYKWAIPTLHLPGLMHPKAAVLKEFHKKPNVPIPKPSPVTNINSVKTDKVNGKLDHTYFRDAIHTDHSYVKTLKLPDGKSSTKEDQHQAYGAKDGETTTATSNVADGDDAEPTEDCALGEPTTNEDDFAPPSPVPEMEAQNAETIFSWQKSELIPADDGDTVISEPEDPSGVSLYCDDVVPNQPEPATAPEQGVKEYEYQCKECGETIDGFQFWCVQCFGCALCGACEARGAHARHYVLRAPPTRPYRQTQVVLATIRHQLQNENMFTQHETDDGVKLEVKEEPPEVEVRVIGAKPPGPDPLAESDPFNGGTSLPDEPHHITVAEEIIDDERPFKRPRLANFIEQDFAASKAVRGTPLQVKVTSKPKPVAETIVIDLDDVVEDVEYLIEEELETDDEVIRNEDEEEDNIDNRISEDEDEADNTRIVEDEEEDNIDNRIGEDEDEEESDDTDTTIGEDEETDDLDTRIVEDEVGIDTRIDEKKGTMILSDCVQRGVRSKKTATEDLPVRGAPESMLKTLTSKPIVQLRPLSSVDIGKWTADCKKRRK